MQRHGDVAGNFGQLFEDRHENGEREREDDTQQRTTGRSLNLVAAERIFRTRDIRSIFLIHVYREPL